MIRRWTYDSIKENFDPNGIKFAFPTVQVVAGGGDAVSAATHSGLELVQTPSPAS